MDEIINYIVRVGGPVTVIAGAMFFLLRHYVTERIKADFAKQLEEVRQNNQIAVEVLRGTMLKERESMKSFLDLAGIATRILIERRIQYYEEYLKAYYALDDAVTELRVVSQHAEEPLGKRALIESQQKFFSAKEHFDSWWARSAAFVKPQVFTAVHELSKSTVEAVQAVLQMDFQTYDARIGEASRHQIKLEEAIRDDLLSIQKIGTLEYEQLKDA
jgi:hypothetical protein